MLPIDDRLVGLARGRRPIAGRPGPSAMDKAYFLSSDIDLDVKIKIIEYVDERPQQKHE